LDQLIKLDEDQKIWTSALRTFLQPPYTPFSPPSQNIVLRTSFGIRAPPWKVYGRWSERRKRGFKEEQTYISNLRRQIIS
jgi:hypothetical protein